VGERQPRPRTGAQRGGFGVQHVAIVVNLRLGRQVIQMRFDWSAHGEGPVVVKCVLHLRWEAGVRREHGARLGPHLVQGNAMKLTCCRAGFLSILRQAHVTQKSKHTRNAVGRFPAPLRRFCRTAQHGFACQRVTREAEMTCPPLTASQQGPQSTERKPESLASFYPPFNLLCLRSCSLLLYFFSSFFQVSLLFYFPFSSISLNPDPVCVSH
jgi:hypothetical protein